MQKSTVGWNLLIAWRDGSEQWIPLSVMKESNTIEFNKFSTTHGIYNEPYFSLWVPYTLQKRDNIISAFNSRVKPTTQNYGVTVLCSV